MPHLFGANQSCINLKNRIFWISQRLIISTTFIIKDAFDFPDCYGMNWDACWDCLTDMVGKPLHIKLIGVERIRQKFPRHAGILLELLKDLKHYDEDCKDQIRIEIVVGEAQYEID